MHAPDDNEWTQSHHVADNNAHGFLDPYYNDNIPRNQEEEYLLEPYYEDYDDYYDDYEDDQSMDAEVCELLSQLFPKYSSNG